MKLATPFITSDVVALEHLKQAPEAFEGLYQGTIAAPNNVVFDSLKKRYAARFKKQLSLDWYVAVGYDCIKLLAEAARLEDGSAEGVKRGLYRVKDFQGATGPISINLQGSSPQCERMHQVRNGGWQIVE